MIQIAQDNSGFTDFLVDFTFSLCQTGQNEWSCLLEHYQKNYPSKGVTLAIQNKLGN